MDALAQLYESRSGSALTEQLTEPPKLVENLVQAASTPPLVSLSNLFGKPVSSTEPAPDRGPVPTRPPVADDEPDEPYIPLTADEIKVRAESKAEMWGALMAMFFAFINRYTAYKKLRDGDKAYVKEFENLVRITGTTPDYKPDHPYFAAKERWDDFETALKESDDDARLNDAQLLMLRRAIEADLKAKNKRGALKEGTITEVLFQIAMVKAMQPIMQIGMMGVNRMVDKTMK